MSEKLHGVKETLVLLDMHAILHRAYHGVPDFVSSKGEPTGALYGLMTMLFRLIEQLQPTYIVACYDLPQETHRHAMYEKYKAHREKTDEALVLQIVQSRDVVSAFGVPVYACPGYEADDVLGTITQAVVKDERLEYLNIVIASGDMDTMQLIQGDRIQVYTLRKGVTDTLLYDEQKVVSRFGFSPKSIPDYKGFAGDQSDNIPGIVGIGEKTATRLLQEFGSVHGVYSALKNDSEVLKKKGYKPAQIEKIVNGEEEAEFSRMLATIRRDAPVSFVVPTPWREGASLELIRALCERYEFRSLAQRASDIVLGVATHEDVRPTVSSVAHMDRRDVSELCLMAWLLNSEMTHPTLDDVYASTKTHTPEAARAVLTEMICSRGLQYVYTEIERPLLPVIERLNSTGVCLDVPYLRALAKEYHGMAAVHMQEIIAIAGREFNLNSPKQLGEVLYNELKLIPVGKAKTPTGQASTKESDLLKMRGQHIIIEKILAYRELHKLLTTYVDVLPLLVHIRGSEARLCSTFVQTGTTTGRIASQDPNLQNIPVKTELGRRIRDAFVARPGCVLVVLDYAQIELRIAAMLSGDEKLIDAFVHGRDVHTDVAAEVFGVVREAVTKEMRRTAKVINFGILYGMGAQALKENLGAGATLQEARHYLDAYFQKYGTLARYIDEVKQQAARDGYTTTLFGRRRYFEGIRSPIPYVRAMAERMAVNAPIQGTQADAIKLAMVQCDAYIERTELRQKVNLVLQVHDELVYEVEEGIAEDVARNIQKCMESVFSVVHTHGVPVQAEYAIGARWGQLK